MHVTLRVRVSSLRSRAVFLAICSAIADANGARPAKFRICHFSVQWDHIHLIVEATDKDALMRGMRGLGVRIARGVNRVLGRHGQVIADRWHGRALESPLSVRHGIVYVLANRCKHENAEVVGSEVIDPCSSAAYFRDFAEFGGKAPCEFHGAPTWLARLTLAKSPVVSPHTWLLSKGWKRHSLISYKEAPRSTKYT